VLKQNSPWKFVSVWYETFAVIMARVLGFGLKPEFRISVLNYKEAVIVENLVDWFKSHTVIFMASIFNLY
jgi:hypothetical protein